MLVTHAYQTFFDRTMANFEALVEGRDIRIGRPVDEPAAPPVEQLMPLLRQIGEIAMPLLQQLAGKARRHHGRCRSPHRRGRLRARHAGDSPLRPKREQWIAEITRFIDGLGQAVQRDLTHARPACMRALVTGAAGLIGAHIVRALVGAGHEVRCLVRADQPARLARRPAGDVDRCRRAACRARPRRGLRRVRDRVPRRGAFRLRRCQSSSIASHGRGRHRSSAARLRASGCPHGRL